MDLVIHQVEQLEDVDVPDGDAARIGLATAAIEQMSLAVGADQGQPVIRRQG
ncbi:unannotated protein [freshwater metagenome]|uniref:Unannotated protein n=1 Tax=freshwater metagenome TaxID=449393 RepID=A0A6J7LXM0_9ZZZZ